MGWCIKNKSMAEFKVGGKVICVKDHSQGWVKKGQVYECKDMRPSQCECNDLELDVGLTKPGGYLKGYAQCIDCHTVFIDQTKAGWFSSSLFLPLDDFKEVTFEKIKEHVPVGVQ
jgi:hypothetical protein